MRRRPRDATPANRRGLGAGGERRSAPTSPSVSFAYVAVLPRVLKRLIIGRPMSSERAEHTLLQKRLALPIFASDALSSVAYATQEIMLVLTVGGTAFLYLTPWVAGAVVILMAAVVASYRSWCGPTRPAAVTTRSPRRTSAARPGSSWPARCSSTTL